MDEACQGTNNTSLSSWNLSRGGDVDNGRTEIEHAAAENTIGG